MAAELALEILLASFFHCRLTIELLNISEPTENFNALILGHVENPWPYMVTAQPWPNDMDFHVLDNRGECILHIFLTTTGKISQAAPGLHWWAIYILHETYFLTIRVLQADIPLSPWNSEFRAEDFLNQPRMLENWALVNVTRDSHNEYIVHEISAMYFYCSREEGMCLKKVSLSTPLNQLFGRMFPLSWPAGSFDYNRWPMHLLTFEEWFLKGESKVEKLLHPPAFRLLTPKDINTGHIFENREFADLLLYFNSSFGLSWEMPEYAPQTIIRKTLLLEYIGGSFVYHGIGQLGFVYCNNKTSPHHYIYSIASPLDWPTWSCAAGTYVAMCILVRKISGNWQLLNLFISLLAQGATLCLQRLRSIWLLWIITAIFFGWFFTSSIEALLVSPTLPTGIKDMKGLFDNGYRLVMDAWSDEGRTAAKADQFMSENAYLRALRATMILGEELYVYDRYFLNWLPFPKLALVLQPEQTKILLFQLQEQFDQKQCFGNPHALSMYPEAVMIEMVNARMVRDAAIRLEQAGLGVWYERNAAVSLRYEWTLRFRTNLKLSFPDQIKENGPKSDWSTQDTLLEGFHRTTDGNELKALLAICSTALAVAFGMFIMEVLHEKIRVARAKLAAMFKSFWHLTFDLLIWIECVVWGYVAMATHTPMRFARHYSRG